MNEVGGGETKRIAGSRISNFPRIIRDYRGGHGIFWDIRWYPAEQRRKRINSSALTRSSHWRGPATKPRAICAARNWINSTDAKLLFQLVRQIFRLLWSGNIRDLCVCDHIPSLYFIYIYISLSLLLSTRRVLFPYPIARRFYASRERDPANLARPDRLNIRNSAGIRGEGELSEYGVVEKYFFFPKTFRRREIFYPDSSAKFWNFEYSVQSIDKPSKRGQRDRKRISDLSREIDTFIGKKLNAKN